MTTYYEDTIYNDIAGFQATVAALVYLTAICLGSSSGYSAILLPQIRTNSSGFEAEEVDETWIGMSSNLFYLHIKFN